MIIEAINSRRFIDFALQVLSELVRSFYGFLSHESISTIARVMEPILQDTSDERNCEVAMEFWRTLAEEEKNIESNPNMVKFITGPLG